MSTTALDIPADLTLAEELANEDLVEMANLDKDDTGIPGIIHIRTRLGVPHGPSVKYFAGRAGQTQPSFSVTITDPPRLAASSLPTHITDQRRPQVFAWVTLNREALLRFWNEGETWTRREVDRFLNGLVPLEKR